MKNFEEIDLIDPLQRALQEENYKQPTPIQAQTIPAAMSGRDVLGCAQTGTGKTAAFALPILNRLGKQKRKPFPNRPLALILAPTRELAIQIGNSFATYGKHLNLRFVHIYGGVNQTNQVRALNRGAHVLVATPGRLVDLMKQGHIELNRLQIFVLDEADRMLDMGFLPDLKQVIRCLPKERQSLFFSATLAPNITELAKGMLSDPISVNVTPKEPSVKRIKQQLIFVERSRKLKMLRQVLTSNEVEQAIVFTRTKHGANNITEKLLRGGIKATAIHGNKSQGARQRSLEDFRRKRVHVLVATDVAARGIDIDGVSHVINYDMPVEAESYVHRIGRTGRAGAEGIALSFCTPEEKGELKAIEKLIGNKIPRANEEGGSGRKSEPAPKSRSERFAISKKPRAAKPPAAKKQAAQKRKPKPSPWRFATENGAEEQPPKPKRRRRKKQGAKAKGAPVPSKG